MLAAVLACSAMGVWAMVVAFACISILWLLVWQLFASRLIGYRFSNMIRDLAPFLLIAIAVMGLSWLISLPVSNIYLLLLIRVIVACVLYVTVMKLSRAVIFKECMDYLSDKFRRNRQ